MKPNYGHKHNRDPDEPEAGRVSGEPQNRNVKKTPAIEHLPQGHPVWLVAYAGAAVAVLVMFGSIASQWAALRPEIGMLPPLSDVLTPTNLLGALMLGAVPLFVAMGVVQLVGSRYRRHALTATVNQAQKDL